MTAPSVSEPAAPTSALRRGVARWPALVALLALAGIYLLLPETMTPGPNWLVLAIVVVLVAPAFAARFRGLHRLHRSLVLAALVVVTIVVASSAALLVGLLPSGRVTPRSLLWDAALIWVANIIVFALWYWKIDGGGPAQRHTIGHASNDFLFPQMAATGGVSPAWSPGFIDYLFLAFNTSTAFSPTDTLVLSRRAKLLMMGQSVISLVVIAVLAARAINTL